jgi:hypothetical protein
MQKSWIQPRIGYLTNGRLAHQRHDYTTPVIVIEARLHHDDGRDAVPVPPGIAIDVETGH